MDLIAELLKIYYFTLLNVPFLPFLSWYYLST